MNPMIFLNGKQVQVIAYFMFESTRMEYLFYCDPNEQSIIYIGQVSKQGDMLEVNNIEKTFSFLMKKFIQELINHELTTVKGYRYLNKMDELADQFQYVDSQKIVIDPEKRKKIEEFIKEINENNEEILEKAKEEYYLQLVEEKSKERKTIIFLLAVLFIVLFLIAKMIIDFMK